MGKQKTIKEKRLEAEILVSELSAEIDEAREKLTKSIFDLKEAAKVKSDFKKIIPSINRTQKSVDNVIDKLRSDRDRISRLLTSVNKFYNNRFVPISNKINDPSTGLSAKLNEGRKFERELVKIKDNFSKQLAFLKDLINKARTSLNEVKKIDTSIRKVENRINSNEKLAIKHLTEIKNSVIKVEVSTKTILEAEKTIKEKENNILELFNKSDLAVTQIEQWNKDADTLLSKIKTIYQIAAGTGLGGEFDKKKKILDLELANWRKHLFYSTIVLFSAIVLLFIMQLWAHHWDFTQIKFDGNFYVRFLLTSPIIFYLAFVTNQYNKTKSLLEKYSFKTALALSIDAHINLLTNIETLQDSEYMKKITDFIIDGFNKIYYEPYKKDEGNETKNVLNDILSILKTLKI